MRFTAVLLALLPVAALADEAEAVYARFHKAMVGADVQRMKSDGTAALRKRMDVDGNPEEQAKKLAFFVPATYVVSGKVAGANRTVLEVQGQGRGFGGGSGTMRGKVTLVKEGSAWKVDQLAWSPHDPSPQPRPELPAHLLLKPDKGPPVPVLAPGSAPRAVGNSAPAR